MPLAPAFTPPLPRRSLRSLAGLPLMALSLAALLPGRIGSLMENGGLALPRLGSTLLQAREAPPAPAPMALREGVVARPTISPVLAGAVRPNPLGEERPGESRLLMEVSRRKSEMEQRERDLEAREARVQAAEEMARAQITELTRLRQQVEQMVAQESTAAEGDIDALVALYVNMRPQQAAKVLERLEAPRVAAILLKIPERQAGPILAQMEPPAALAVTQEIAGRREAFRSPAP